MSTARSLLRPALLACAAVTLCLAGTTAGGAPLARALPSRALAGGILPVVNRHAALSWGCGGLLGNGTAANSSVPGAVTGLSTGVVQVAAGWSHSLALTSSGTVWAWGDNTQGELGNGTTTFAWSPGEVTGLTGVTQVAAGHDFSLALRSDGTVWAWGENAAGQLGTGVVTGYRLTPAKVVGLTGVTKIVAGGAFALALRSDGTVWAWGDNTYGELGDGVWASSPVPVQVQKLSQVTSIAASAASGYAIEPSLTTATTLWAWGDNRSGELGIGTTFSLYSATPVQVTGVSVPSIAGVAAAADYALALGSDGSVWAWGDDYYGQFGDGTGAASTTVPVETIAPGTKIIRLAAGGSLALALRSDGTVLAWGDNSYGELGDGSTAPSAGPVQVIGLTGASQVSAGYCFSLAVYLPAQYS